MLINYITDQSGNKLFSFFRHDYRSSEDGSFIDGGFDYIRTNRNVENDQIENLIEDIREQFTWTSFLNEDKSRREIPSTKLLKDLDTDHIIAILIYFTERINNGDTMSNQWKTFHLIFLNELKFRHGFHTSI